jgi:hypothetical protein
MQCQFILYKVFHNRFVFSMHVHVESLFTPLEYIFPVLFSRREKSSEIKIKLKSLNTFFYSVWKQYSPRVFSETSKDEVSTCWQDVGKIVVSSGGLLL